MHLAVAVLVASIPDCLNGVFEGADSLLSLFTEAKDEVFGLLSKFDWTIELLLEPFQALPADSLSGKLSSSVVKDRDPVLNGYTVLLEGTIDTGGELDGVDVHV